jgi:SH3-like domain-containing protein
VAPNEKNKSEVLPLHDKPDHAATVTAKLQVGVQGAVKRCNGTWCRISGEGFDGWIQQERLWGVYPNERLE